MKLSALSCLIVGALLAAPLLACAAEGPGDAPAGVDAAFWKQLVEIDSRGAGVKDLTAAFTQEKFTPLMKRPQVSSGTIKIKDAATLWETVKPSVSAMRIDARELRVYYPEQQAVEVFPINQGMGPLAASPFPRLALIKPHFSFERFPAKELMPDADEAKYVGVRMRPTNEDLRKHIDEVRVVLEVATGLVLRAQTTDPDGDRIVLTFSDLKANTGLTDRDVALTVPAGVKISRPLEGGREEGAGAAGAGREQGK